MLLLGVVIGANNFSAALALGALGQAKRRARIVAVFAVFEFVVPLVGAIVGQALAVTLAAGARWISAALLLAVGAFTIAAGVRDTNRDERIATAVTSWRGLLVLAAGLSADNLAVGFGLGLGRVEPVVLAGTIVVFSTVFTWVGISLGNDMRRHWERRSELVAGGLLVCLGVAAAAGWL
jgi:putative Mn2+ efflux pump MntP